MLLSEPFGQRLWLLFAALSAYHVGPYNSKPLPCTKNPQTAAKIISKGQQTLVEFAILLRFFPDCARLNFGALQLVPIALCVPFSGVRAQHHAIPVAALFFADLTGDALKGDV